MEIRILKSEDIESCVDIIKRSLGTKDSLLARKGLTAGLEKDILIKHKLRYLERWVLIEDSKVMAIFGLYSRKAWPSKTIAIGWFAVDPNYQNKGYGKRLIEEMQKISLKLGYNRLTVWSDKSAIEFYKKSGFNKLKKPLLPVEGHSMLVKKLF